ncbi:MAG TPA: PhoU domain-containing protein [Acidimicrobiales bacterium]|jgi:phosphate transport system protein|nr:PhoU domain-containing protein [Acidimicrobiales bacterium]
MTMTGLSATDLSSLDTQVLYLFAMVSEGLAAATAAFLSGDKDCARSLSANDHHVDELQLEIENLVFRELTEERTLTRGELAHLLLVMQIVPELERSGDLVEHIALRTPQDLARAISPRCRSLIEDMGRIAVEMWRLAATAFRERDPTAADRLRVRDDEIDDLHVTLTAELATVSLPVPVAIEMGLVARFFERLGDHAVNVSRRLALSTPAR